MEARVMFHPKKARRDDYFLCVMQPVPAGTQPLACRKMEMGPVVSAVIADRIAVFQRNGKPFASAFRVIVPKGQTEYRVLVNNLAPGRWRAVSAGRTLAEADITAPATVLYFRAKPGQVMLTPMR